jgi:hypothetical protein
VNEWEMPKRRNTAEMNERTRPVEKKEVSEPRYASFPCFVQAHGIKKVEEEKKQTATRKKRVWIKEILKNAF